MERKRLNIFSLFLPLSPQSKTMSKRSKLNIPERKLILFFGDLIIISFGLFFFINSVIDSRPRPESANIILTFIGFFIYFFLAYVLNFYYLGKESRYSVGLIMKGLVVTVLFIFVEILSAVILFDLSFWRVNLLIFLFGLPFAILLWRRIFTYIFKFISTTKHVLYLYNDQSKENKEKEIEVVNGLGIHTFYEVQEAINIDDPKSFLSEKELRKLSKKVDSWIINIDTQQPMPKFIEKTMLNSLVKGKEVITFSSFYENIYEAIPIVSYNPNDSCAEILQLQHTRVRYLYKIFNFTVNFLLCLFVGLVFALVTPFVYLLNFFFNRGPLFYTQKRVGRFGKEFKVYKFRSMVVDAEKSGAKMAKKNDARITPFGKILRMFRVDELPQIMSVINGDMLFIGPRPERKVFVRKLNEITPYYNIRHLVKPGVTGWAQVKYRYGENLEDSIQKLEYDLYYIKNRTITLDLRIIFKTFTTILFSRGI